MSARTSNRRIHSVYLDDAENAAVVRVAEFNHQSPNAVCRSLIRSALGLQALALRMPPDVAEWAERRAAAAAAEERLAAG